MAEALSGFARLESDLLASLLVPAACAWVASEAGECKSYESKRANPLRFHLQCFVCAIRELVTSGHG